MTKFATTVVGLWRASGGCRPSATSSSSELVDYARACGAVLARAHARSGNPVAITAYLGRGDTFEQAISRFAAA
jgi:hypothetical protein